MEEGLHDLNQSYELDPYNPYYLRNLGIYYQERGDYQKALELFLESKSLDNYTYNIDALIIETRKYVNQKAYWQDLRLVLCEILKIQMPKNPNIWLSLRQFKFIL